MFELQYFLIGIIQGVTEFLPISSSGHLVLFAQFTDWEDQGLFTDIAVHFGTLFAVILYLRKDIFYFLSNIFQFKIFEDQIIFKIFLATLPSIIKHNNNPMYKSLGASGAISAIVFAYILIYPLNQLGLLIIPGLWLPGFIFGALYLVAEHFLSKKQYSNVAHDAHISGSIFGVLFIIIYDFNNLITFFRSVSNYFVDLMN